VVIGENGLGVVSPLDEAGAWEGSSKSTINNRSSSIVNQGVVARPLGFD
jgi:hypothetical protein